jgi:histidinol-phosphate aminotransferase
MNVEAKIPERVRRLVPYQCARDLYQGDDYLFLDANEAPAGVYADDLNRYPDPYARTLRKTLADSVGLAADNLFVGSGSDEIIDLLIKALVDFPHERLLATAPSYPMYTIAAGAYGVPCDTVMLNADFSFDAGTILKAARPDTKLLWLCSPNNPTGNRLDEAAIMALCGGTDGFVVVDEAYIEFALDPDGGIPTLAPSVAQIPNLIVLRTFSKAWGLAGVRLGWAAAHPAVVAALDKVKEPYNVPAPSQRLAEAALRAPERMQAAVRQVVTERNRMAAALQTFGWHVFPSDANFLLTRLPDTLSASDIQKRLAEESRIVVRDRSSQPLLANCLRLSVGTHEQNDRLLVALAAITGASP